MFKPGEIRGSIVSPIKQKSARYQIWESLEKGESPESIKNSLPSKQNGSPTLINNVDIEVSQWKTWKKRSR